MNSKKSKDKVSFKEPKCPTCGNPGMGLLNGLGLMNNKGKQIWVCFSPCNKIIK